MSESMFMSLDDEFGKNGYIIRESKIQKGCEYPVHWHDYFEFEVILDGTGIHTLNDRKYTVSAGSAYLLSYCDFHSIRADTDMRLINLRFCEEAAEKELVDYIQPGASRFCVQFAEEEFKRIIRFTDILYQEQNSEKPFAGIMSKSMISAVVTELIRKSASFSPSKYRPKHVQSAVALIRRDFRNARNSSRNSGGRRKLTVTDGALPLHLRPAPGRAPPRFDASLFMLCDFLKQGNGIAGRLNRACKSFRGRFTVHIDHT